MYEGPHIYIYIYTSLSHLFFLMKNIVRETSKSLEKSIANEKEPYMYKAATPFWNPTLFTSQGCHLLLDPYAIYITRLPFTFGTLPYLHPYLQHTTATPFWNPTLFTA